MKLKKVLALAMSAGMLVSAPLTATASTAPTMEANPFMSEEEKAFLERTAEERAVEEKALQDKAAQENAIKEAEQIEAEKAAAAKSVTIEEVDRDSLDVDLVKENKEENPVQKILNEETVSPEDMVRVIIIMDGDSIIENDSDATMDWANKLKTKLMEQKQDSVVSKIEKKALGGDDLDVNYHYTWLLNGVAAEVPYGMIEEIEAIKGVKDVILQPVYEACETADPQTVADGVMIGRDATWADGYTGKGIKIAIVDTGIDEDHQNFGALAADKLTEDSATKSSISSVLGQLNASALYSNLTADDVYYSTKIAYGFNYVDRNLVINHGSDDEGDHGTHVAGIAAANDLGDGEAVGVAPDAQLYVMKVFGAGGGAYTEDILAAVEDSLILGADVINMSLGSPAGFTSDGEILDAIYGRVSETNTILAISAGNSATMGEGNLWGTNTNLTSNPDNSTVGSPATYVNATSVASVDNVGSKTDYLEVAGKKLAYQDGSGTANPAVITIAGQSYDYAMVPNCGQSLEDFTNADVAGKIAVVQRGVTAFTEKCALAQEAGAVACLIYNNTSGTISMDLSSGTATIPCASITMQDGEFLASAKAADASATIFVSDKKAILESETAYRMSDFSSWGVSPDLCLEPDITAPGGNIYSTRDNGTYGLMSGTSMASPNMAGVSALVMQYAKANYPEMSASELHNFVNALITSTAIPLAYDETLEFSPRSQGTGLVNAYNAVKTGAYLSVKGEEVPKIELGDDVNKAGAYSYAFNVTNFSEEALYYTLSTTSQTEGVMYDEYTGKNFMSMTPVALAATTAETSDNMVAVADFNDNGVTDTADARQLYLKTLDAKKLAEASDAFRYDVNKNDAVDKADVQAYLDTLVGKQVEKVDLTEEVLKVAAGETAAINVSVNVAAEGKNYMDTNFENGIYVEGFTTLTAKNAGGVDLSLPYLAFYGDWTKAPILDSGYYWQEDDELEANQYYNILFTALGNSSFTPGTNPYLNGEEFDMNHISLSPNNDGIMDYIDDMYVSLLRNARTLSVSYTDDKTGEVYFEEVIENVSKSCYSSGNGLCLPFVYSWYGTPYTLTDKEGNALANNTKVTLSIKAAVDYDKHASNNLSDEWIVPITIDTEAPVLKDAKVVVDEATGTEYLQVTFSDNVNTAAIMFLDTEANLIGGSGTENVAAGENCTMLFNLAQIGNEFYVLLGDYAGNEKVYSLSFEVDAAEAEETEVEETAETEETETEEEPETEVSETEEPETEVNETEVSETEVPETEVNETEVPETEVPETEVPETEVPETEVNETEVSETEVPETEEPETETEEVTEEPETESAE